MLIVRGPGGFHGRHVTAALTSHVDLYPPLLELAGAPVPEDVHGHSLLPLCASRRQWCAMSCSPS
jgi:arylsulfatase A-like enzyme